MNRWIKQPGPGEFRGEGRWQPFEGTDKSGKTCAARASCRRMRARRSPMTDRSINVHKCNIDHVGAAA